MFRPAPAPPLLLDVNGSRRRVTVPAGTPLLWALRDVLGAALHGEITVEAGRVRETNFEGYRLLGMHEAPRVEVHFLPSTEPPTGLGEPRVPPLAPAVANAVCALTGARTRRLPLRAGLEEPGRRG